ncbi:MAG: hypothetical protein ACRDQA_31930, partial [Nocardioidaceae bacterium]
MNPADRPTTHPLPRLTGWPPSQLSRRALLRGGMAAGGAALLAACGETADSNTADSNTADPHTTRHPSSGVTLTDQRGKKLVLDHPVTRLLTIPM